MDALRYCPKSDVKLQLKRVEVPVVEKDTDVLIEVKYAGLCGSDLHVIQGEFKCDAETERTLGHEISGIIVDLGEKAKKILKVGMRVAMDPNTSCEFCEECCAGCTNYCKSQCIQGIMKSGGMAKYVNVQMNRVYEVAEHVKMEQGALTEPLSCILHGFHRLNTMPNACKVDNKILVVGLGIIGNLWLSLLHHKGFRDVIASEAMSPRREIAKKQGLGFDVLSPDELDENYGEEFNVIIDCTGSAKSFEKAMKKTAPGAVVIVFGCTPIGHVSSICPEEIFRKELTIMGVLINPYTFKEATALVSSIAERYLQLEKLGVQLFSLAEYEAAIDTLKSGKISKAMFKL